MHLSGSLDLLLRASKRGDSSIGMRVHLLLDATSCSAGKHSASARFLVPVISLSFPRINRNRPVAAYAGCKKPAAG